MAVIRTRATANPAGATVEAAAAVPAAHGARDTAAAADGGIRGAAVAAGAAGGAAISGRGGTTGCPGGGCPGGS